MSLLYLYYDIISNTFGVTSNNPGNAEFPFFDFQNNVISHDLEYKNKEDIFLSAIVKCQTILPISPQKTTKNGF